MKKLLFAACLMAFFLVSGTSCSPKYGCEINESTHSSLDNSKGGNSNLFPKHMRRQKRKKG